jgi:site-specific DNA-methyltransferase (adenine-specific)
MIARCRPGEVRDAIVQYLSESAAATVKQITQAVAGKFPHEVAPSSIRSYLRLNTPEIFERLDRGQYRLKGIAQVPGPAQTEPAEAVFSFGQAQLFHADCFDWLAQREPNSIHGVVTDPPYGLVEYSASQQQKLRAGRGGVWRIPPSFDGHKRAPLPRFTILDRDDLANLEDFFRRWARVLLPALVPGAHVVVASNPLLSYLVAGAMVGCGFERRGEIIRLVMTMRGGDRPKNAHEEFPGVSVMSRSMWEPWLLFRKPIEGRVQDNLRKWKTGGLRRPSADRPFGDVIKSHPTPKRERLIAPHPSLKPQGFLRQVVRSILPLGEGIVLDPFAGAGSTLAAAEVVGYQSIGIEKDPHYIEIARRAIPALATVKLSVLPTGTPSLF